MLLIFLILELTSGKICSSTDFNNKFTSKDYCVQTLPEKDVDIMKNELIDRQKCKTCCRVIIASDFNYEQNRAFQNGDTDERYVLDMEFDNKDGIRKYETNYEQNILLRPLQQERGMQQWEFAPYKMFTSYVFPKRVHDIRGGSNVGSTLIIWQKKAPLAASTDNQRFVYIHPYPSHWYSPTDKKYFKHFYLPFHSAKDLCYEAQPKNNPRTGTTWIGMRNLVVEGPSYQIAARICDINNPRQKFVPVYV